MARYPAWLHRPAETGDAMVVSFPDLPGCLAIGETEEDALTQAEAALTLHLEGFTHDGVAPPPPQALGAHLSTAPAHATLLLITARPPKAPAVRVNITVDKNLLVDIDAAAADSGHTRSGFLAEAARRMMRG